MKTKLISIDLEESILRDLRTAGLSTTDIAVAVDGEIITLTGFVDNYSDKVLAENTVRQIKNVHGIASDIKVRKYDERTDPEIVKDALDALRKDVRVPSNDIKVTVRDGWLVLDGRVGSHHMKDAAEDTVKYIGGVRGVANHISISPPKHAMV